MKHLYAPWRSDYIGGKRSDECVFCHISRHKEEDDQNQVLYRDDACFIVMNKYPYTPGHFMIIPHTHTDKLENLNPKIWLRMSVLAQQGVKMLKDGFNAQGVNIGMNLGAAAGAGIAEHIHLHLVPRFQRDTNFITSIGETRVYGTDFQAIYERLKKLSADYFSLRVRR